MKRQAASPVAPQEVLPELLAPVGSPEAFRTAVSAGADAVYFSGKQFGARMYADNFTEQEIGEAVTYTHEHGVAAYVTVNTLIHDQELSDVAEYLIWLWSAEVDAVLVQDLWVTSLAKELVLDLPLHASTQMTIHSTAGLRWAAEQGFSRVVLARELTLLEVEAIARATTDTELGLEVFAHGALCYSYSDQYLLFSIIDGRSWNRGMCTQTCRKQYTLVTWTSDRYGRPEKVLDTVSTGPFLLSTKDLCTYHPLERLVASPVAALMIGRRDAPNNRGITIGIGTRYDSESRTIMIRLHGQPIPSTGDGKFFSLKDTPGDDWYFWVNTPPTEQKTGGIIITVQRPVKKGAAVFITSSRELEVGARRIVARPPEDLVRPVSIDLFVRIDPEGCLVREGVMHPGQRPQVSVFSRPEVCLKEARTHPLMADGDQERQTRTGGTPCVIRNFAWLYNDDHFIPIAELNRVHRDFLRDAQAALAAASVPSPEKVALVQERWYMKKAQTFDHELHRSKHAVLPPVSMALYRSCRRGL